MKIDNIDKIDKSLMRLTKFLEVKKSIKRCVFVDFLRLIKYYVYFLSSIVLEVAATKLSFFFWKTQNRKNKELPFFKQKPKLLFTQTSLNFLCLSM